MLDYQRCIEIHSLIFSRPNFIRSTNGVKFSDNRISAKLSIGIYYVGKWDASWKDQR